jgi:hypothetical protein
MMSTCCSKHVEAWNKYIKKECVKLVINQNYVKMHGQQNIKLWLCMLNTSGRDAKLSDRKEQTYQKNCYESVDF